MLKDRKKTWSNNNIRIKKGAYIIDFIFIKDNPYELMRKVVTSFKENPLPDLDVKISNEFINNYYFNNVKESPEDSEWDR